MSTPDLKLALIAEITRLDDPLLLRTLYAVLQEGDNDEEFQLPPKPATAMSTGGEATMLREDPVTQNVKPAYSLRQLVADDEVIGTRPDGTPVTAGAAVEDWDADVAEVLAGGGYSVDEVLAFLDDEHRRDGYA